MRDENPATQVGSGPIPGAPSGPRREKLRLTRLITNPWFGGIAGVASIISLPLAFYLYLAAQEHPRLTMYVNPIRTAIVKSGQTSALKVFLDNKETGPNVTAVQIAIWNDGKGSIRREGILDDITLHLNPEYSILESSVRKVTRSVTGFQILPVGSDSRRLALQWKILEPGDGAVIQVIYDGPASVGEFLLHGTIEGQTNLVTVAPKDTGQPEPSYSSPRRQAVFLVIAPLAGLAIAFIVYLTLSRFVHRFGKWFLALFLSLIVGLVMAWYGYYVIAGIFTPYPPFGF